MSGTELFLIKRIDECVAENSESQEKHQLEQVFCDFRELLEIPTPNH